MSFSARTRIIGIHKAPAHLSRQDMETKYRDLASAFASLPIAQEHGLKYEVCFANGKFDENVHDINLHGFEVTVVSILETKSDEALEKVEYHPSSEVHLTNVPQIMTDPAFQKLMQGVDFLDRTAGGTFAVDVVSLINRG
ncbi:hypothetical protein C8F04DRAFT_1192681 [Mycena alexandri]|uniref:Uncharacterized protein n=1 Tax=Mycena alexandri TaxID=1745969 RepID=A0AAD6SCG8_9AGAR|nr:hypothetical protein C8F04DRAFT_1192681 [Mycena alexandri]